MSASLRIPDYSPREITVGRWRITALADGWLRLDGGAMWGVVPKAMWSKMTPADERNRILLALRPFLLRDGEHTLLLEPGVGDRWSEKELDRYEIDRRDTLEESLARVGVDPSEITHLAASHGHWDHIGAAVVERDGELVPRFPGIRLALPRVEAEMTLNPDPVRRGSYRPGDLAPLDERGLVRRLDDGEAILPGVRLHILGGHSDGSSVITIEDEEGREAAVFWGDVCPTSHHIQPPYIMAYDINAGLSYQVRSRWFERAAEEGLAGLFYHDPLVPFARLEQEGRRYRALPLG